MATEMDAMAGDPGRVHEEGQAVRSRIEAARDQVGQLLGVRSRQIVFSSGGTEAINAAVFSAHRAALGQPIVCAGVEHSAVREASARWASVLQLEVDHCGRILIDSLRAALDRKGAQRPALVHCQWANHEVATLQPVQEVVELCREAGVPVHVDACAAIGRLPINVGQLGANLVSLSAHKFGGPSGVGALVVSPATRLDPFLVGGQQERARRAGFEHALGIVGFGAAADVLNSPGRIEQEARTARAHVAGLLEAALSVPGVSLIGDPTPEGRLPHLVCLGIDGVEAEPIVISLDRSGIAVHSGSACSSEGLEPSPVLAAMGVDPEKSLRLSVGWSSTAADVIAFGRAFSQVVFELRSLRG